MANIISRRTKDDPKLEFGEPSGDLERFYLGRSIRGIQVKQGEQLPIGINGHYRYADMGEDNEMEKEFIDVLEQAASQAVVPDGDEHRPRRGDQPATMRVEMLGDFELRRDSKRVPDVRSRDTYNVPGGKRARQRVSGPRKYQPIE